MGAIVVAKAGELLPDPYQQLLMKQNFTGLGTALVQGGTITLDADNKDSPIKQLEVFTEYDKTFKEYLRIYYMGDYAANINVDDLQPFPVIKDDKGNPLVVAFLEGNFVGFAQMDSAHSDEYSVVERHLKPKLTKLWRLVKNNLDEFMNELDDDSTKDEMAQAWTDRGVIAILAANGRIFVFSDNEDETPTSFGWVSRHFGYTEGSFPEKEAVPPPVKEPEPVLSRAQQLLQKAQGTVPPAPPKDNKTKPPLGLPQIASTEALKSTTATIQQVDNKPMMGRCPDNILGRDPRRDWYKENEINSRVPDGYKKIPGPVVQLKPTADLKTLAALGVLLDPTGKQFIKTTDTPFKAPAATAPLVEDVHEQGVIEESLPVVSEKVQDALHKDFMTWKVVKKSLDPSTIFDPKTIPAMETKHRNAQQILGIEKMETMLMWDYETLRDLCRKYPDFAAILALDYAREISKSRVPKTIEGTLAAPTIMVTPPSHQISAVPPPPPKKRGGSII